MTEVIKWNDKEYKMPFDADYAKQKTDSFKEEVIVTNPFSVKVNWGWLGTSLDPKHLATQSSSV